MNLSSFAAFAAVMFAIFDAGISADIELQTEGPTCYQLNMKKCDLDLDIQLVTDMSGGAEEELIYGKLMKNLAKMLNYFLISPYNVRIGHIAFSNITEEKFNMSTFSSEILDDYYETNVEEMKENLNTTTAGGWGPHWGIADRDTGDAMEQAWLAMQRNGRKSSQKAYMVFTTGNTSEAQLNKTKEWAEKMRDDGLIFSIGWGMTKGNPILSAIANGNEDTVFGIEDETDFLHKIPTLVRYVCKLNHVDCIKCQAHAAMHNMRKDMEHHDDDHEDNHKNIPQCDEKNNRFKHAQVDEHDRWCVLPDGTEIKDTKQDKDLAKASLFDCEAKRTEAMLKPCEKRLAKSWHIFKPSCYSSCGYYQHHQCLKDSSYCWCSLLSGVAIPGTIWHKDDVNKPDCLRHRDLLYSCIGKEGTFPHPWEPKRFIHCDAGNADEQVSICLCGSGTQYDHAKKTCMHAKKNW